VITLMMLLAMGLVAAALIGMSSSDMRIAGYDRRGTQAQFAAEAGVQEALHRMALRVGDEVTVNGDTFDPAIADTNNAFDPNWEIRIYKPSGTTPTSADASVAYTPTVQSGSSGLNYFGGEDDFIRITHKWTDRDGDTVADADEIVRYDPNRIPPENFDDGFPVNVVEVQGQRGESVRRVRVETTRFPFTPNVLAAVTSDGPVDIRGNVKICGQNHDIDTPVGRHLETKPPCSPDSDEPDGHLPAVTTTGDDISTSGSSSLLGFPTVTDSSSSNPFYTLAQALGVTEAVMEDVLVNADHFSATEGSPLDGLTFVDGDATDGEKFSDIEGSGLLYVTGNLDISGDLVWRGLIYVEGDLTVEGNPWIVGGIIVRGKSEATKTTGTSSILYSREALLRALENLFPYTILSWKEI
jgi:hypothetical protein